MKIKKSMFKSLKGLKELKKMQKTGYCNGIECSRCPLDRRNLNTSISCADIIDLDGYAAKDFEEIEKMDKLIDIFTEEKINTNLSLIDKRLKYNSKVIYNGETYLIKGVLKKRFIKNDEKSILLNGFCNDYDPVCANSVCIIKDYDAKKEYNLFVNIQDIEI